jgi:hypothetical protein
MSVKVAQHTCYCWEVTWYKSFIFRRSISIRISLHLSLKFSNKHVQHVYGHFSNTDHLIMYICASIMCTSVHQTCVHLCIKHVYICASNMCTSVHQTCVHLCIKHEVFRLKNHIINHLWWANATLHTTRFLTFSFLYQHLVWFWQVYSK